MQSICSRCNGTGYEAYDEDYRRVRHSCYHCGETGYVSDETAWQDELGKVASALAYNYVSQMRKDYNSDPEGEGWDFCAAENMMTSSDYFKVKCWEYEDVFMSQLLDLPPETHNVLVAWNKFNNEYEMNNYYENKSVQTYSGNIPHPVDTMPHSHMAVWGNDDGDVPF